MTIKDKIGDMLGYARCEYSNKTMYKAKIISVMHTPSHGHMFVADGVKDLTDEQLINYTKSLIKPTLADLEELKRNPNFKMYVDRGQYD